MYITPIIPSTESLLLENEIINKAEQLVVKSALLVGGNNKHIINTIRELLRKTNSYYSNMIESEGTHPIQIDKAMNKQFSPDSKERKLQLLSLVHIEVQKYIEENLDKNQKPFLLETILDIHHKFYSKEDMKESLDIEFNNLKATMIPGKLREMDVKIGEHIAPNHKELNSIFNEFEILYNQSIPLSKAMKIIYALCSHHRLVYIHPFLDGNGRISRLYLDYLFLYFEIDGYGLWNISRGLSRSSDEYRYKLSLADEKYKGYNDGRGPLSLKELKNFLNFMLDIAIEQVEFMAKYLKIDSLVEKIESYVKLSQIGFFNAEPLPKHSEKIFKELLVWGEISRGKVQEILGTSRVSSSKLIAKLIELDFLESDSPKSAIRLKFNSHFASYIIPELIPLLK